MATTRFFGSFHTAARPISQGQLVFHDGALYGTSYDGGKPCPDQQYIGCGTVWKLTP
jgi:hypothetical protein